MLVAIHDDARPLLLTAVDAVRSEFEDRLEVRWDQALSKSDRGSVVAFVTNNHAVSPQDIHEWRAKYPGVRIISLAFTGYDGVTPGARHACAATSERPEVQLWYAPTYATDATAQWTVQLMTTAVTGRVLSDPPSDHLSVINGSWHDGLVPRPDIDDTALKAQILHWPNNVRRVGVIGTGRIGRRVEKIVRQVPERIELRTWSRRRNSTTDLIDLLKTSDIVTLHLRLDSRTRDLLSPSMIAHMPPNSILVNSARSGLVNTQALLHALEQGAIAGAALDVFDHDNNGLYGAAATNDPLIQLATRRTCNLVVSPHLGFKSVSGLQSLARECLQNVCSFYEGRQDNRLPPLDRLDRPGAATVEFEA